MFSRIKLLLLTLPALIQGSDIGCFVPGYCADSTQVGISFPSSPNGCLEDCYDNSACFYYSYEYTDDLCVQFTECDSLVNRTGAISGHVSCDPLICDAPGQCEGTFLDYESASSSQECLGMCAQREDCEWYSYNPDEGFCFYFADCERVSTTCASCSYGQQECYEGSSGPPSFYDRQTLIVVGSYGETEVISLEGKTCDQVPHPPISNIDSYGFVSDNGVTPNLCNGADCYRYIDGNWSVTAGPSFGRGAGAGTQFDDERYWMTGGIASGTTTEYWTPSNDAFSMGPNLVEDKWNHCVASFGEMAYIAGDFTTDITFQSFNSSSGEYKYLATVPGSHSAGICGTALTSNDGPEFIITVEPEDVHVYNINTNVWSTHGMIPLAPQGPGYVQYENTWLYMGGTYSLDINQWDPDSRTFFTRTETLSDVKGTDTFALLIDGTILNCK